MKRFDYKESLVAQNHKPQLERIMAADVIYVIETEADYTCELPDELRQLFAEREKQNAENLG